MIDRQLVAYLRWRDALPSVAGLDPDAAWAVFVRAHEGRCGVCRRQTDALVNDHCHVTGWIRGRICRSCNNTADSGGPNVPLHNKWTSPAITAYVQLPPADVMGLRRQYVGGWGHPTDLLERAIWCSTPVGLMRGGEILDQALIEKMRAMRLAS